MSLCRIYHRLMSERNTNFMIIKFVQAHQQNDKAVMQAYGFWGKLNTETECVAELMKMYQELTAK